MSCLFALRGAQVTMMDKGNVDRARDTVTRWGLSDRVRLVATQGGFDEIAGEPFDVVFTKSVLWCIEPLAEFLTQIHNHLAPGGRVAFVENYRGGKGMMWLRRVVKGHGDYDSYVKRYFGITKPQLALFRNQFADVRVRRHRFLVWEILGHRR
jgi:SAM-dependent methyltransferase